MKLSWIIFVVFAVLNIFARDVVVPSSIDADSIENWSPPVDSILTAGDTVRFVTNRGLPFNVPYVGIFTDTDGYIYFKTATGKWDSLNIVAGGYHEIYVNKISPRSSGKNLHVKMSRKR